MANLQYKTRGMSNPKGKPRVYFCCHEAEFEKYFETISEEILKLQNCAIWYGNGEEARDEEYLADLGEIQLFVMPVTTKLLTTENAALDVEFRFAVEHHIPVLPLMQESGLDELFSAKCGDLQYLDKAKNAQDITEIPYEEKLKTYLESVLVSDEMAEKIRAAFDAYVFLSYRKKDRKYAQELMRLIHKNDFCRDIAIWYDEFLTPGENFNESIREALQKSRLFVMAVTPNLVSEPNYIMTTEYPMAKEEGKPILPVEVVPTDKKRLAESFADLPDCTDPRNEVAFSEALLENVKKLAIRSNDDTPEHNFFIGLAYLGGVDVEVDHARAVELITGAANQGLVEAVSKLVEMYRNGIGVKYSYETAVRWQEEKMKLLEVAYWENPGRDRFEEYRQAGLLCGDYYKELERLDQARNCYEHVKTCVEEAGDLATSRDLAAVYSRLGNICREEGKLVDARRYYEWSHKRVEEIMLETGTAKARRDLTVTCGKLGRICEEEGDLVSARKYYERAYGIGAQLVEETGTAQARDELSFSCNNLGDICKAEGDLAGARRYYEQGYEIREQLAAEMGTVKSRRDLSVSCNRLGNLCKAEGDIAGARRYYEQAYEIDHRLVTETGTAKSRRDLSFTCGRLGDICKAEGDLAGALRYYERAYEIDQQLVAETGTAKARRDLSISQRELEEIKLRLKNTAEQTQTADPAKQIASLEDDLLQQINAEAASRGMIAATKPASKAASAEDDILRMINAELEKQGKK